MLKRVLNTIPAYVTWLTATYVIGMVFFSFFRLLLLVTNWNHAALLPSDQQIGLLLSAFVMGLRFDGVISGYILALPAIVFIITSGFKRINKHFISKLLFFYVIIVYSVAFALCSTDIPYFTYYFSRLTTAVLNWANEGSFMFGMITREPAYLVFVIVFLIIVITFYKLLRKWTNSIFAQEKFASELVLINIISALLVIIALFISVRGRLEFKSPIRAGTAYFSSFAFPNQLGLNPVFTFIRSYLDDIDGRNKKLQLLPEEEADAYVRAFFSSDSSGKYHSPVYRIINGKAAPQKLNVVLILMESMSADKLGHFGNPNKLTPFLDSLINQSYSFEHFYSAGIHTFNGVFSTLYSFPSLLKQHPMKVTAIPKMTGLPVTLQQCGYSTVFFTTHDEQFDNMSGFMYANGFEKVISQKDFPKEWVLGPTGVPDHILFQECIPYLNRLAEKDKPFFAAMLTASDHGPYNLPEHITFKPTAEGIHKQIVQYADWSLRQFFATAAKQSWFKNTIFILTADHGANLNASYSFPLAFVHTPCIIFSTAFSEAPKKLSQIGGQIDVFPTVMGLLGLPYENFSFGVDLFSFTRPYMFFSNDEKIGCIDSTYFYIRTEDRKEYLYNYREKKTTDEASVNEQRMYDMRKHAFSMMQSAQKLLHSGNTKK